MTLSGSQSNGGYSFGIPVQHGWTATNLVCPDQVLDGRNIKCNIAKYPRGGGTGFRGGGRDGGRGPFRGRGRCVLSLVPS